jgi:prephenate dehydratase
MKDNYPLSIACQGAAGSFSHLAGQAFFKTPFTLVETKRFEEIFLAIVEDRSSFGVLPIENSLIGSIYENYDLLCQYDIPIRGEVYLRIQHNLLVLPDQTMTPQERISHISQVCSHPKALEQCRMLFEEYPHFSPEPFSDTAGAARFVAQSGDLCRAAIASEQAAHVYGLTVLLPSIEDDPQNYTRFLVVGKPLLPHGFPSKVSLVATLEHEPGSLLRVLSELKDQGGNLTKIESRPVRGKPFQYLFYLDVIHPEGADVLVRGLARLTTSLRILGEYSPGDISPA